MSTQLTVAERQILRNELPIEILRLEDVNNDDGDVLRLHSAKHFEFVWLKEGGGDLVIELSESLCRGTKCTVFLQENYENSGLTNPPAAM